MNKSTIVAAFALLFTTSIFAVEKDTTFVAQGNPVVRYKYTADPAALVHDGKIYIYAGHDQCPPPEN